ncbi:hypothetical protein NC652_033499 [Populus alba x Populus x berolinensis]|nr:hypothetical protein NC652_033499 [Populus alba x Populus x berolinensis]
MDLSLQTKDRAYSYTTTCTCFTSQLLFLQFYGNRRCCCENL